MTTHTTDLVHGGWIASVFGWAISSWTWATAGMPPLNAALTLASLALTAIKVADAYRRYKASDPARTRWRRLRDSVRTRPAPLDHDTRPGA